MSKSRLRILPTVAMLVASVASVDANQDASRPRFSSKMVSTQTPGHAVEIDVDIKGAKMLFLVVREMTLYAWAKKAAVGSGRFQGRWSQRLDGLFGVSLLGISPLRARFF